MTDGVVTDALNVFRRWGIASVHDSILFASGQNTHTTNPTALAIWNRRGSALPVIAAAPTDTDIRTFARTYPQSVVQESITLSVGLRDYQVRRLASALDLPDFQWIAFIDIAQRLYACHTAVDATYSAIHPLYFVENQFLAGGGALQIDPHAHFRQPIFIPAAPTSMTYVRLHGDDGVACIANSAGFGMATLDLIAAHGGTTAHFVDIGSGSLVDNIPAALTRIAGESGVRSILINLFCGLTRCADAARALVSTLASLPPCPTVVRLAGIDADDARAILDAAGLAHVIVIDELSGAVHRAIALAHNPSA